MLMIEKNASNILIYPSQMDFFHLRLEGFLGLALRRPDRIVSLVAFVLWSLDFSLVSCLGSRPHFIRATTCAALTFFYTTCLLVVETLIRFPFRVLSTRDSLNDIFRGQGLTSESSNYVTTHYLLL